MVLGSLHILIIVGLMRGSEVTREIFRGLAGIGVVLCLIAMVLVCKSGVMATSAGMLVLGIYAYSMIVSGFTFWVLGQQDVRAWVTGRRAPTRRFVDDA